MFTLRAPIRFAPRAIRPAAIRNYAKNMQSTQGQASPGTASNVAAPGSASSEQQEIKKSRATDSTSSPDTASVQSPVSNPSGSGTGQQEDDTSTQQAFKQDPDAPAGEKAKEVEKKGQRPLDAADK
ncbi:hypothetical protein MBLNU457_6750t1 [Dothideomycetes sp. NU457]